MSADPNTDKKNIRTGTSHDFHSWIKDSDHLGTARLLINAGAKIDPNWLPTGCEEMDKLLTDSLK